MQFVDKISTVLLINFSYDRLCSDRRYMLGVYIGVLASTFLNIALAANPARIPFRRVAIRALPRIALSVMISFVIATLSWEAFERFLGRHIAGGLPSALAGVLIAFMAGQVWRLKDAMLTMRVAQRAPALASWLQFLDETSRLYLDIMYSREERAVAFHILERGENIPVIDRLFEFHCIEIVRDFAGKGPGPKSLSLFRVRFTQVKLLLLLRHLGYSTLKSQIEEVAENPSLLFPTWPVSMRDRRVALIDSESSPRRRKYEAPFALAYATGISYPRYRDLVSSFTKKDASGRVDPAVDDAVKAVWTCNLLDAELICDLVAGGERKAEKLSTLIGLLIASMFTIAELWAQSIPSMGSRQVGVVVVSTVAVGVLSAMIKMAFDPPPVNTQHGSFGLGAWRPGLSPVEESRITIFDRQISRVTGLALCISVGMLGAVAAVFIFFYGALANRGGLVMFCYEVVGLILGVEVVILCRATSRRFRSGGERSNQKT